MLYYQKKHAPQNHSDSWRGTNKRRPNSFFKDGIAGSNSLPHDKWFITSNVAHICDTLGKRGTANGKHILVLAASCYPQTTQRTDVYCQ